jgi:NAD+ kinase
MPSNASSKTPRVRSAPRTRNGRDRGAGSAGGPRVVVVSKRTPYGRFVEEEHDPHVLRLIKRKDPSVARWKPAHDAHVATLRLVERTLKRLGARPWVLSGPRVVFDASDAALVVTVGGDGTLLAASHHVGEQPILGVNSSPDHSVGFFCPANASNVEDMLVKALQGRLESLALARMQVEVDGRLVSRRVLNECLFCHEIPAAASRYIVRYGRRSEEQLSSGLWVGTAAGSTGALQSAGGEVLPLTSETLQLVAREPFRAQGRRHRMTKVLVEPGRKIDVTSKMHDAILFLDGPFQRTSVRLGETVTFHNSSEPLYILGLSPRRARRRA